VSGRPREEETEVLIVGGSLVGLTAALLLRLHGVDALAVERHTGTAIHPRAGHFQLRTVEILRAAGVEAEVRRTSEEQYHPDGGINNVESLAGREIATYFANLNAGVAEFSPTIRLFINQDALEPILRRRAEALGARLSYRTECVGLHQDADGVTAALHDLDAGEERTVRCRYVIAADGNRSPTRTRLGIDMHGHGLLSQSITIYFRSEADLAPLLEGRNHGVNYVTNPTLRGFFRLDRRANRGFLVINLVGDTSRPEVVAAFPDAPWANVAEGITEARALELLRAAIGVPEIPVVIEDIAPWQAIADSAQRYRDDRVFLAGDAAHVVPPNGGFGGNTGVQDAHNLAWKLAFVLRGIAGPGLLDSYDAERRPIGELTVEQAYARYVTRVAPYLGTEGMQALVDDMSLELGCRCNSAAVALEDPDPPLHEHPSESRGRPGSRAPHVPLTGGGPAASTLDLFGGGFVVLCGPDAHAWQAAGDEVAGGDAVGAGVPLPLAVHRVDERLGDRAGAFAGAYGVSESGASLVRPDGIVAWRSPDAAGASAAALRGVMGSLLSLEPI
jgi:2-polyprenyl-6-methoxyphenol hydroxylase-like FAD-dependent oxidoreductase